MDKDFANMVAGGMFLITALLFNSCKVPDQDIVLRQVKDVMADASSDPVLKGEAVFFNPNSISGKLKHIKIDIFVNGKKAGEVDKNYALRIPAKGEFSVPLEVKLNLQEMGTLKTLLGVLGGKKFDIKYVGSLRLSYHGMPVKVPIDHSSQLRVSF
jgi:LEA14-like dessication related protein